MNDGWTAVSATAGDVRVDLRLPPGWWSIHPGDYDGDVAEVVADALRTLPSGQPPAIDFSAELGRLARFSAMAGAILLAGGAAVDPLSGKIVTASLAVMPYEIYLLLDHTGQMHGPDTRLELPAGRTVRHLWLGDSESILGRMLLLEAGYVIVPPQPPSWVLCFHTPSLDQRAELVEVFDAVAATTHISQAPAASIAGAFG